MDRQHKAMVVKAIERHGKREVGDLIRNEFGCGYAEVIVTGKQIGRAHV